jgi:hypothetical protein
MGSVSFRKMDSEHIVHKSLSLEEADDGKEFD